MKKIEKRGRGKGSHKQKKPAKWCQAGGNPTEQVVKEEGSRLEKTPWKGLLGGGRFVDFRGLPSAFAPIQSTELRGENT